jgi:hypothetical protein
VKIRTLLSTALLAIVSLALMVPAVGQSVSSPGLGVHWQIALRGATARNSGTAEYFTFRATVAPPSTVKGGKLFTKFTVEAITPDLEDGSMLDVFLGPSTRADQPYGKLVGTIDVDAGVGAMVLIAAKVPVVQDGTTVSIVSHVATARETLVMKGTF